MLRQILTATGVLIVGLLVRFFIALHKNRTRFNGLPKPPHSYLFGNLKAIGELVATLPPGMHPHTYSHYLQKKYNLPGVFYLDPWPFGEPICAIIDPEAAQQPTVQHSLPKHPKLDSAVWPVTGENSLVSLEGAAHKMWRSTFNPGFNTSHLMTLVPGIVDDCLLFADIMAGHAKKQDIVLLEEGATKLTIDIIGKTVLDVSMNAQTTENEFVTAFRNQLDWLPPMGGDNPIYQLNPLRHIVYWLNERKMNNYLTTIMNKRFASRYSDPISEKGPQKKSKPVIDLALDKYQELYRGKAQTQSKTLDQSFQREALNHIKVFMLGGHDTSSSTICFTAYALSRHPSCLTAFRHECDQVFGTDISQTASLINQDPRILNRLPYTLALIKETLRLWPAVSSVRLGQPDFFINYENQQYPTEGFMTWPVIHAIHRNPKFWPRANEFLPERWLAKEGEELFPVKGAWRAFEYGPRNCIGQELAILEMKICMVLLWREFMVEMAYDEEVGDASGGWAGRVGEWTGLGGKGEGKGDWGGKGGKTSGKGVVRTTPEGERAYQVLVATAKPCEGMPVRVVRR